MINKIASLPPHIRDIIIHKGTEKPFSGLFNDFAEKGTYLCRQCGLALFHSQTKFHSGCGWPSFDAEIPNAIAYQIDADGMREEILCARCHAHLGHVFKGEGFTAKNLRHCVNSTSLDFVADLKIIDTEEAIVAAGCFWGVEHYFKMLPGVLKTQAGYTGGSLEYPHYEDICEGNTGHYEALRIVYNPQQLTYENLIKYFFEIHDPTQVDGQGPDLGEQYHSAIFVYDEKQKEIATSVMRLLENKGYTLATKILPVSVFWPAEKYHQDYYTKTGKQPYCHRHVKRF